MALGPETPQDPTARFQGRADAYRAGRPGYPEALFDWVWGWLEPDAVVADLGSGTGILTRRFLERGHRVFAVEPNPAMRSAAEQELAAFATFVSVAARAENTSLPDASIDLVTAAQAFHWFDFEAARLEVRRVLRPEGRMLVVWNDRVTRGDPLSEEYEALVWRWAGESYAQVARTWDVRARLEEFFAPGALEHRAFANDQELDLRGLVSRLHSSSYMPGPADPRTPTMLEEVAELFERHQGGEHVVVRYRVNAYLGRWSDRGVV